MQEQAADSKKKFPKKMDQKLTKENHRIQAFILLKNKVVNCPTKIVAVNNEAKVEVEDYHLPIQWVH